MSIYGNLSKDIIRGAINEAKSFIGTDYFKVSEVKMFCSILNKLGKEKSIKFKQVEGNYNNSVLFVTKSKCTINDIKDICKRFNKEIDTDLYKTETMRDAIEVIYKSYTNESVESLDEATKLIGTKSDYGMYPNTNKMIEGVNICIQYDDLSEEEMKEQLDHLDKDFSVVKRSYKNFLNGKFKEWLKISDSEFKTLKIYEICYKYSGSTVDGTKKGEKYSHFEFCYQYNYDDSKGTCPVAMELVVVNGKVLKSYFTDI